MLQRQAVALPIQEYEKGIDHLLDLVNAGKAIIATNEKTGFKIFAEKIIIKDDTIKPINDYSGLDCFLLWSFFNPKDGLVYDFFVPKDLP